MQTQGMDSRAEHRIHRVYALLLIAVCLLINVVCVKLALALKLPLYLDNIGSALAAAVGGSVPGMAVGPAELL